MSTLITSALDIYRHLEADLLAGFVIRNRDLMVPDEPYCEDEDEDETHLLSAHNYHGNATFSFEFTTATHDEISWLWDNGGKFSKNILKDPAVTRYRKLRLLQQVIAA